MKNFFRYSKRAGKKHEYTYYNERNAGIGKAV